MTPMQIRVDVDNTDQSRGVFWDTIINFYRKHFCDEYAWAYYRGHEDENFGRAVFTTDSKLITARMIAKFWLDMPNDMKEKVMHEMEATIREERTSTQNTNLLPPSNFRKGITGDFGPPDNIEG